MTKTLYVGNLPWSTSEEELTSAFAQHTQVEASRIITDRMTGRSRGFGFVEIPDEDVEKVIDAMNGTDMEGRQIVVNEAREREERY